MRRSPPGLPIRALTALATVALLASATRAQLEAGAAPAYTFAQPPVNGDNASSLADFQGKLLWVEFWASY